MTLFLASAHSKSRRAQGGRPAFTLVELIIALSISAILLAAAGSAIFIASRSVEVHQSGAAEQTADAARLSQQMTADLRLAVSFDEIARTTTMVEFTVPDRNEDGVPETIRYAWGGGDGDPLTRAYNGSDPYVIAEDVHHFDLSYLATSITGTGGTDESGDDTAVKVLFVVKDPENLNTDEAVRQFLLESWGHTVTLIDDEALAAEYDTAIASNEVAYVSDQIRHNDLGTKLTSAAIGVVVEHKDSVELLDLAGDGAKSDSDTSILIDDNSHYITKPFFPGLLPIYTQNSGRLYFDAPFAPGGTSLASDPEDAARKMLIVVEKEAALYSGAPAPERRVMMPWADGMQFSRLNDDGKTLLRRALSWAARREEADAVEAPLFAQSPDPGASDSDHTVKASDWAVASIVPALPPDAISWKITRFRIMAEQKGDPVATLMIQVRGRAPDGEPTDDVLAQSFLFESDLPLVFDWIEIDVSMLDPIPADEGACIAIGMLSGSDGGKVYFQNGIGELTPSNQFYWKTPGAWDTDTSKDVPIEVHGTVETPGP